MTKKEALKRYVCIWDVLTSREWMTTKINEDGTHTVSLNGVETSIKHLPEILKKTVEENIKEILHDTSTHHPKT